MASVYGAQSNDLSRAVIHKDQQSRRLQKVSWKCASSANFVEHVVLQSKIHSFCPIFSLPYLGGIFLMWAYRGVIPPETSGQAIILLLPILYLTNQNLKALCKKGNIVLVG